RRRGIVRRLRPGDAGDGATAELLGPLRELPLDRVGDEARDDVRRARHDADEEAEHGAPPDRPRRLPPLLARGQELAEPWLDDLGGRRLAGGGEDLGEAE